MLALTKRMIENRLHLKVFGNWVEIDDVLYPLPLVEGNEKLGRKVWHGSTVPANEVMTVTFKGMTVSEMGTCPMKCPGCYGLTNNYNYDSTKFYLIMRTKLLRNYPAIYFQLVEIQLETEKIEKLRIHATGDFIPGEAIGYYNVLKKFPNIKAWTYTKVENDSDIELLNTLKNMNVVKSIIKEFGFNFGHCDYIMTVYEYLKANHKSVFICRCGTEDKKRPETIQHCSDCDGCSDHEYVLFIEHSTSYKAKKDKLFPAIVKLINSKRNLGKRMYDKLVSAGIIKKGK